MYHIRIKKYFPDGSNYTFLLSRSREVDAKKLFDKEVKMHKKPSKAMKVRIEIALRHDGETLNLFIIDTINPHAVYKENAL